MAILSNNSVHGTEFKLALSMTPIDTYNLSNTTWEVKVFVEGGSKFTIIKKEDYRDAGEDTFIVPVDSKPLGAGRYFLTLTVLIPDGDFPDGFRTERRTGFTGVTIDAR